MAASQIRCSDSIIRALLQCVPFWQLRNGLRCSNQRVLGFTGWRLSCGLVVHGGPAVHELIMRQPDFEHLRLQHPNTHPW